MQNRKHIFPILLVFSLLLFLSLVSQVYAIDETGQVNLLDFPQKLSDALGIPLFAAQILACLIISFIFLLPIIIFSRKPTMPLIVVSVCLLSFFVAIGWLPIFIMLILILIVAALWSGKTRDWLA